MAHRWYYAHGEGKKHGPFTADEMRSLAQSGDILRTDTVWLNDSEKGALATKVQHLFPPAPAPAPPQAPPPTKDAPPEVPPVTEEAPPDESPVVVPRATEPARPPAQEKKRKAYAVSGATIVGQDNSVVRFRKWCTECKHEDSSYTTIKITVGTMAVNFYCSQCRKRRQVKLRGAIV